MADTTFLGLVNRARRECGVAGQPLTTLQSGLSAEGQRFKDWVGDAWRDLQLARTRWSWMRLSTSFNTVADQSVYTLAQANVTNLAEWLRDSFRAYRTSIGVADETFLPWMDWEDWRDYYQFNTIRTTRNRPLNIAVMPDKSLAVGPLPDEVYTIVFEYERAASELDADADDPCGAANGLPSRFHMLVVYGAMKAYATFESAPEVASRANSEYARLFSDLVIFSIGTMDV